MTLSIDMQKLTINTWNITIKINNHHIFNIGECKNFIWFKKLPVSNFEWIEDTSQFNEEFTKNYNEESDERYFFKVEIQYTE